MFRFKLRTLLIATALTCVFFGLQVHVHKKARRFVEEVHEMSESTKSRLLQDAGMGKAWSIMPEDEQNIVVHLYTPSLVDYMAFRRNCLVSFEAIERLNEHEVGTRKFLKNYTFKIHGESHDSL